MLKLLRDDMVRSEDAPPLKLFAQGIRSDQTRTKYTQGPSGR